MLGLFVFKTVQPLVRGLALLTTNMSTNDAHLFVPSSFIEHIIQFVYNNLKINSLQQYLCNLCGQSVINLTQDYWLTIQISVMINGRAECVTSSTGWRNCHKREYHDERWESNNRIIHCVKWRLWATCLVAWTQRGGAEITGKPYSAQWTRMNCGQYITWRLLDIKYTIYYWYDGQLNHA